MKTTSEPATDAADTPPEATIPGQMNETKAAWLALALAPGLGSRRILQAIERIGSAEQVLALPLTTLETLNFPATAAQAIADGRALRAAQEELQRIATESASLVAYAEEEYPERLKQIFDPPPVLWFPVT
jgi:DNA processing protein